MAKVEFLQNFRTARNLFYHRGKTSRPSRDPRTVEAQLSAETVWLAPSSVRGFSVREFQELSPDDRNRLKENVERFLQVAKEVPPVRPPTPEQAREAIDAFLGMQEILEPYFVTGGEDGQVRQILERVLASKDILTWDYELGSDSTGDDVV
jgi:hypothetical protein